MLFQQSAILGAEHPKTLVLWTHQQKLLPTSHWNQGTWERRVVTFDDRGGRSETGFLAGSAGLNWPSTEVYAAWALPAFPRRGRAVGMEIEERSGGGAWNPVARFVVSNPDPGPHPQWPSSSLPARCGSN